MQGLVGFKPSIHFLYRKGFVPRANSLAGKATLTTTWVMHACQEWEASGS